MAVSCTNTSPHAYRLPRHARRCARVHATPPGQQQHQLQHQKESLVAAALAGAGSDQLAAAIVHASQTLAASPDFAHLKSAFAAAAAQQQQRQAQQQPQRPAQQQSPWGFALRQPGARSPPPQQQAAVSQQPQWDLQSVQQLTVLGLGSIVSLTGGNSSSSSTTVSFPWFDMRRTPAGK